MHRSFDELRAGLDHIRSAPPDGGTLELIVRRPAVDEREVLEEGRLCLDEGLVGDTWRSRGSRRTLDGGAHPDMQLNLMGARVVELLAGDRQRWALAGDQLFVDLDLSEANLPPGTRLAIGEAVIEVTAEPHRGCAKFERRFGADARRFVNAPDLAGMHLRGINARVVQPGAVRRGDTVTKV